MSTEPIVRVNNNSIFYRASALGSCPRSLWASRSQLEPRTPPDRMQAIFDRGHEIEDLTKRILGNNGYFVSGNQEQVTLQLDDMFGKHIYIIGHIDGFTARDNGQPILTEIKGFGTAYLDKWQSTGINGFPAYAVQISAYLHAMEEEQYRYIIYQKDHPSDEDSYDRLLIQTFDKPPLSKLELEELVRSVEKAYQSNSQPSCPDPPNYPCPYFHLHDETESSLLPPLAEQLSIAYETLKQRGAKNDIAKKNLRERILGLLDPGNPRYSNELGTVKVTIVNNPDRLNGKKARAILKDAGVPDTEYITVGSGSYPNITVNLPELGDD